jgi:glycosyltransferase involved in cell wall biosynthesis
MKTKVVYIVSEIGRALAFEWIAGELNQDKFDLSFVLINPVNDTLETFLRSKNVPLLVVKGTGKKSWPVMCRKVFKYLKQAKPNIVHCHLQQASFIGLLAAKLAGIKVRIHTRHHSSFHHVYFPKGVWWDKLNNRMSTHIVAISSLVKRILMEWEEVPANKITLVPHGFLLSEFEQRDEAVIAKLSEKYNPAAKTPVIGVISRFIELKGIQYIIPAFKELLNRYPDALLLLFNAQGDYTNEIDILLQDLSANSYQKVNFEPDIASVYKLMDVFVHVPIGDHYEAFGQIYVEALAAGVPSVFTLSGIAPDFIVDGENAVVVPYKNDRAICKAISSILEDDTLRSKIVRKGMESVKQQFALRRMIDNLENLYDKAIH